MRADHCKVCGADVFVALSVAGVESALVPAPKRSSDKTAGVVVVRDGYPEVTRQARPGEERYLWHTHGSAS